MVDRDLPESILLDAEMSGRIPEEAFVEQLTEAIIVPVADFMDQTPSLVDLVPLHSAKLWLAFVRVREVLSRRGHVLPAS